MDHRIRRTIRFIEANYSLAVSIKELTQSAKLSRSRFRNLFKNETGLPPMRYVKQIRIRSAAQLFATKPSLSIKEVMASVGLDDKSHFARDFKRILGVTPTEYRERYASKRGQHDD